MLKKIEFLRKQSKEVRNRYAFLCASVITVVIAIIWAFTVPSRFDSSDGSKASSSEEEAQSSFIQGFVEIFREAKTSVVNVISTPNYVKEEIVATTTVEDIDFRTILASSSESGIFNGLGNGTSSFSTTSSTTTPYPKTE